jgi:lactoylglutathione lyase
MRTLHVGLRVSDLERSLAFYRAVGYTVIGTVEGTPFGSLTMLQLPGDPFVTIELVHDPAKGTVDLGTGINHLVIQVQALEATLADLAAQGIAPDPAADPGPDAPRTRWITDPDGYRIELVQWPTGHADGITKADFPEPTDPLADQPRLDRDLDCPVHPRRPSGRFREHLPDQVPHRST